MTPVLHRLIAGGTLAAGAVTLGFAAGGLAAVDDDLAAAARPAPLVRDSFVEYRPAAPYDECPERRPLPGHLGQEL